MKIAHLADIHSRLIKRHRQYRIVFQNLYDSLRKNGVDVIIIVGDLNHNKISVSNELIELMTDFFRCLNDICPVYIVPGNHDYMVKNASRQDSISPIVKALNLPNINYLKYSQEVDIGDGIVLNHLSIVDKDKWREPSDLNKTNIALYHGAIIGAETDAKWIVDKSDIDLEHLEKFDYAFLGDLHKANQMLDREGKIRYSGSLISQDFSEDNEKGFLLWNIKGKNDFTCEFVPIENPNPFVTIELEKDGSIPKDTIIKEGAYIRLVSSNNLTYEVVNRSIDLAKIKFNPESVVFVNKCFDKSSVIEDTIGSEDFAQENFRDTVVQEKLIEGFLRGYEVPIETMDKVFELNRRYNTEIERDDGEIKRNINWKLKKVEWENLFNYGTGNVIDFTQLNGITGLFGKSFSGKTSAIEVVLYTIFNSISKNSRKNFNIINQNKNVGRGKVEIEINNETYTIERISEKYDRRLHGKDSEEAKTVVDFKRITKDGEENLNGSERNDTDKIIRRIFGTIDDFLLTSMSSQFGSMAFLNEGSTKRKEIMAKFLDLDVFEGKFKSVKDDVTSLRASIKRSGNLSDFDKQTNSVLAEIKDSEDRMRSQSDLCSSIKHRKSISEKYLSTLDKKIEGFPSVVIDIEEVDRALEESKCVIKELQLSKKSADREMEEKEELLGKFEKFEAEIFNIEEYKKKQEDIRKKKMELKEGSDNISSKQKELGIYEKRTKLLKEVPCGEEFKRCKFISDAFQSLEIVKSINGDIECISKKILEIEDQIRELDPENVDNYVEKYERVLEKKNALLVEIPNIKMKIGSLENELLKRNQTKVDLERDKEEYEKNREVIENYEKLVSEKRQREREILEMEKDLERCESEILNLHRKHGSLEQQMETIEGNKKELERTRKEFEAYDLFMKCCHSDGIPFQIIKRKLSYINLEIAKVLMNVVPFVVFFESEEDRLNLFIQHSKFGKRPLEMASGAEKVLSSLAIRLALTKISNLPKCSILILDEPALNLDSDILDSFSRLMSVVKQDYETVVLITHLEELKDIVDSEIIISKKDDYAYINQ
ncbi:MAG: metallophosphoesterase [Nanoarchaeota archaeon]|nr:metallophosphoesterase [Nanoarchaeota archaeon]